MCKHFGALNPEREFDTTFGELAISSYLNCGRCLEELPTGMSPQEFKRLDVGFTSKGIQVICTRHNCAVAHLDFMGQKVKYADDAETKGESIYNFRQGQK